MALLSWCIFLAFFEPLLSASLISINRTRVVLLIHILGLVVDVLLDLYLIPRYGYFGACYANMAAYGTIFLVSLVATYHFLGGFSLMQIAGRVLPLGLLMAGGLYFFKCLASWNVMSPEVFLSVEIFSALVLYPLLLSFEPGAYLEGFGIAEAVHGAAMIAVHPANHGGFLVTGSIK